MTAITMPTTSKAHVPDLFDVQPVAPPIEQTELTSSRFGNYRVISWYCPAANAVIRGSLQP